MQLNKGKSNLSGVALLDRVPWAFGIGILGDEAIHVDLGDAVEIDRGPVAEEDIEDVLGVCVRGAPTRCQTEAGPK